MKKELFSPSDCLTKDEILLYRTGEADAGQIRRMEEHIVDCPLCSDALEGTEYLDTNSIKDDFHSLNEKSTYVNKSKRLNYYIYSAAAAVVVIGLTFLFTFMNKSTSSVIFDNYFEPYPDITVHQRGESENNEFANAMNLYNDGKYEETADMLRKLETAPDDKIIFYRGVSLLASETAFKAAEVLQPLTEKSEGEFFYEANWYSALAFLNLERIEEAKFHFNIAGESSDYSEKVKNILTELKNE